MPDLHPEVLKEIEAGRKQVIAGEHIGMELVERLETPEEFARRCVQRAVELEREECASIASAYMSEECPSSTGEYGLGYSDAAEHIHAEIVRRGKP